RRWRCAPAALNVWMPRSPQRTWSWFYCLIATDLAGEVAGGIGAAGLAAARIGGSGPGAARLQKLSRGRVLLAAFEVPSAVRHAGPFSWRVWPRGTHRRAAPCRPDYRRRVFPAPCRQFPTSHPAAVPGRAGMANGSRGTSDGRAETTDGSAETSDGSAETSDGSAECGRGDRI